SLASIRFLDLTRVMMESSLKQQRIAEQIVARMPSVDPGTDILLYDTPGVTNGQDIFFGLSLNLTSVLRVIYRDSSITGHLCVPDGIARGGGNERCELYSSEYTIFSNDEPVFTQAYAGIVVFRMMSDFPDYKIELMTELPPPASSDTGYDPYRHFDPDADYPSRYHTMIDRTPLIDRK
ncbi:MAG: hypothetical protein IT319_06320, partial [Anaerolineae bacterium]|nr:hypothetical protein [Anaerolineae bacterium]